jgi:hypothetical protein
VSPCSLQQPFPMPYGLERLRVRKNEDAFSWLLMCCLHLSFLRKNVLKW